MFNNLKNQMKEDFVSPELLDESLAVDFILEGADDQFPEVQDNTTPDEDRDLDGADDTVSISELDYEDLDDGMDDSELMDVDLDSDDLTDLDEINEDEEEDEIVEDVINEALDNILLSEGEGIDEEIDSLLEGVCKTGGDKCPKCESSPCKCKGKKALKEEDEEVVSNESTLFGSLLESDEIVLGDFSDEDEEGEEDEEEFGDDIDDLDDPMLLDEFEI